MEMSITCSMQLRITLVVSDHRRSLFAMQLNYPSKE